MEIKFNPEVGTVTFRLKEPKSHKQTLIQGTYLFKELQIGFTTGLKILPQQWDKREKKIISGEDKKNANAKLNKFRIKIPEYHTKFNDQFRRIPTKEELKTIVQNAINEKEFKVVNKKKKSFDEIFKDFMEIIYLKKDNSISQGQKPLHKSYISSFNVTFDDLKKFAKEKNYILDIDTFDVTMSLKFQNWLLNKTEKLQPSTVKTRVKRIGQILKWAFGEGLTNNRSFLQNDFSVKTPSTLKISLTENEIDILYYHDFSDNKRLEKVRDLFILACHTSLRYGDLNRISPKHIDYNNKSLTILTSKVNKTVTLSFFGYTEEILRKYHGEIDKIAISNQKANDYLKEIFKEVPYFRDNLISIEVATDKGVNFMDFKFDEKITFHDSRRSFCTNRYIEGWDLLEIWQYTGHTNERTFREYFNPTFEHEKLRKENIRTRNEKLKRVDLWDKEKEELKRQIEELKKEKDKMLRDTTKEFRIG